MNKLLSLPILHKIKNKFDLENGNTYYIQISNYIITIKTEYFVNYNESGLTFFKKDNSNFLYSGINSKINNPLSVNKRKQSSNLYKINSITSSSNNSNIHNNVNLSQTINSTYAKENKEYIKNEKFKHIKNNDYISNINTNNLKKQQHLKSTINNKSTVNNNNNNNNNSKVNALNNNIYESYVHITVNSSFYDTENYTFPSSERHILIGRDPQNNNIILETKNISKIHCSLIFNYSSKKWILSDGFKNKQSTCGTWIVVKDSVLIHNDINEFRYGDNKFSIDNTWSQ